MEIKYKKGFEKCSKKEYKEYLDRYNREIDYTLQLYYEIEHKYTTESVVKEYLRHLNEFFYYDENCDYIEGEKFVDVFNCKHYKLNNINTYIYSYEYLCEVFIDPKIIMPEPVKLYFQHLVDVMANSIMQGNKIYLSNNEKLPLDKLEFPAEIIKFQEEENAPDEVIQGLVFIMMGQYSDKIAVVNICDDKNEIIGSVDKCACVSNFKGLIEYLSLYYNKYTDSNGKTYSIVPKEKVRLYTSEGYGDELRSIFNGLSSKLLYKAIKTVDTDEYSKLSNKCRIMGINI